MRNVTEMLERCSLLTVDFSKAFDVVVIQFYLLNLFALTFLIVQSTPGEESLVMEFVNIYYLSLSYMYAKIMCLTVVSFCIKLRHCWLTWRFYI